MNNHQAPPSKALIGTPLPVVDAFLPLMNILVTHPDTPKDRTTKIYTGTSGIHPIAGDGVAISSPLTCTPLGQIQEHRILPHIDDDIIADGGLP